MSKVQLIDGFAEYRWNAGSGEGVVRTTEKISDGKWHTIGLSRRGRRTTMTLDADKTTEAESAGGELDFFSIFVKRATGGLLEIFVN